MEFLVLGGGCFWCLDIIFQNLKGVESVIPGYAGGFSKNPTYIEVCTEKTGHAEVIKIEFDPKKITINELLNIFWKAHDPTTLNRQGNDIGKRYRSIILYSNQKQYIYIEKSLQNLKKSNKYSSPILTEIKPLDIFYTAEEYHHDYYNKNPNQPYCNLVINPKLKKLNMFKKKSN